MSFDYEKYIGVTPDFPKKGISFKDVSPLLRDPVALNHCIDEFAAIANDYHPTVIIGPEARGFAFGTALALKMNIGFVMARKKGKLPGKTKSVSYDLEYGTATLEIPEKSFKEGDRVIIIDDLMATGGTAEALCKLIRACKAEPVLCLNVIELDGLNGKDNVSCPCKSLIKLSDKC